MRAPRIAALGLLPLAAACWMERPNLQSTGGGYTEVAAAATPPQVEHAGSAEDMSTEIPVPASGSGPDSAPAGP
ncbi:MAG TPA: hypothetical protein VG799_01460 [Gemmatimonadota bacterium]|jgi:hypothetical protein|nr:hypothetical protein [Gemmatimonadota bacterium]